MSSVAEDLLAEIDGDVQANRSGLPVLKIKDGQDVSIRVLPGLFGKTKKKWFTEITQHWLTMPNGKNAPFLCPEHQFGEPCDVCDRWKETNDKIESMTEEREDCEDSAEVKRLTKEISKLDALKKRLSFRKAYRLNVVNRADRTPIVIPYEAPKTVWEAITNEWVSAARDDNMDIFDVNDGYDLKIARSTENKMTKYSVTCKKRSSPLSEDAAEIKSILDKRHMLESGDFVKQPDPVKFKEALEFTVKAVALQSGKTLRDRGDSKNEEEDDGPPRGARRNGRREEEEDDGPRRSSSRSSRRDEEEDDGPRRSTSRGSSRREEEEDDGPRRSTSRRDEEEDDGPRRSSSRSSRRDEEDEGPRRTGGSSKREEEDDEGPSPTARTQDMVNRFSTMEDDDE